MGRLDPARWAIALDSLVTARRVGSNVDRVLIVTGSFRSRPETIEQAIELSLEHVWRSRLEPGCLFHSVHRDVEDPLRLVFLERGVDAAALRAHFAVPASDEFVHKVAALADGEPELSIYDASAAVV
jgi:quinol monooxygenase YgiN